MDTETYAELSTTKSQITISTSSPKTTICLFTTCIAQVRLRRHRCPRTFLLRWASKFWKLLKQSIEVIKADQSKALVVYKACLEWITSCLISMEELKFRTCATFFLTSLSWRLMTWFSYHLKCLKVAVLDRRGVCTETWTCGLLVWYCCTVPVSLTSQTRAMFPLLRRYLAF